jgi:hypothetical protein
MFRVSSMRMAALMAALAALADAFVGVVAIGADADAIVRSVKVAFCL